jgi:hypothetical protein
MIPNDHDFWGGWSRHPQICEYIYIYTCTYIHICNCICVCVCRCRCTVHVYGYAYAYGECICMCIYIHMYMYLHTRIHVYISYYIIRHYILYDIILYYIILYYIILCCIILHYITLQYITLHYIILYYVLLFSILSYYIISIRTHTHTLCIVHCIYIYTYHRSIWHLKVYLVAFHQEGRILTEWTVDEYPLLFQPFVSTSKVVLKQVAMWGLKVLEFLSSSLVKFHFLGNPPILRLRLRRKRCGTTSVLPGARRGTFWPFGRSGMDPRRWSTVF